MIRMYIKTEKETVSYKKYSVHVKKALSLNFKNVQNVCNKDRKEGCMSQFLDIFECHI